MRAPSPAPYTSTWSMPSVAADGVQVLCSRARPVGLGVVADPPGAPRASCIDEHDVASIAQGPEQRQHRVPPGRGGHAVAAGADENRVARLRAAAVRVDLEPDAHVPRRGIGGEQRYRHRAAARAAGAGSQVGRRPGGRRHEARRRQRCDRHPRARRGYQRKPHPAQFGSQRCSSEMCGAPDSSALRRARWWRTKAKRISWPWPVKIAFVPLNSTFSRSSSARP